MEKNIVVMNKKIQNEAHICYEKQEAYIDSFSCLHCPICLNAILNDEVVITRCLHVFCFGCLASWVKEYKNCPICRAHVRLAETKKIFNEELQCAIKNGHLQIVKYIVDNVIKL